jgi:hypothetical protein
MSDKNTRPKFTPGPWGASMQRRDLNPGDWYRREIYEHSRKARVKSYWMASDQKAADYLIMGQTTYWDIRFINPEGVIGLADVHILGTEGCIDVEPCDPPPWFAVGFKDAKEPWRPPHRAWWRRAFPHIGRFDEDDAPTATKKIYAREGLLPGEWAQTTDVYGCLSINVLILPTRCDLEFYPTGQIQGAYYPQQRYIKRWPVVTWFNDRWAHRKEARSEG